MKSESKQGEEVFLHRKYARSIVHPSFVEKCLVDFVYSCWQTSQPTIKRTQAICFIQNRRQMKEKQEKPTHKSPPNGFTIRKMGIKRCGLSQSPDLESKTQNKGLISGTKWSLITPAEFKVFKSWSCFGATPRRNTSRRFFASPVCPLTSENKMSLLSLYFQRRHVVHLCTIGCGRIMHMWHDFTGNCHFTPFHQIHAHTATSSRWHKSTTLTRLFTAHKRRSQWHHRPGGCLLNFIHPSPHSQHISSSLVLLSIHQSRPLSVSTSVHTGSSEPWSSEQSSRDITHTWGKSGVFCVWRRLLNVGCVPAL